MAALLLALLFAAPAHGHGQKKVDKYGCHKGESGAYHCHWSKTKPPVPFGSQKAMLKDRQAWMRRNLTYRPDKRSEKGAAHYYARLRKSCGRDRCCRRSVKHMKDRGYLRATGPRDLNSGCPTFLEAGRLECEGGVRWCRRPWWDHQRAGAVIGLTRRGGLTILRMVTEMEVRKAALDGWMLPHFSMIDVRIYGVSPPLKDKKAMREFRIYIRRHFLDRTVSATIGDPIVFRPGPDPEIDDEGPWMISAGRRELSRELVRLGLARWDRKAAPDDGILPGLELNAMHEKRGIWASGAAQ